MNTQQHSTKPAAHTADATALKHKGADVREAFDAMLSALTEIYNHTGDPAIKAIIDQAVAAKA